MSYDLEALRKKVLAKNSKGDVMEFKPPKVGDDESVKYRFFILPPLSEGDKTADGTASRGMDGVWSVTNGMHFHNNKAHTCPRASGEGECPLCQLGFDMMEGVTDKKARSAIAKQFLASAKNAISIYFPKNSTNPPEVAGKVMWFNAPNQIHAKFEACVLSKDGGDDTDPQAFGVFYDENAAYLFQLEVTKKGEYNSYENSKFLATVGKVPIATTDKVADKAKIKAILDQRHDLFTKFKAVDMDALNKLVTEFKTGDTDENSGFEEDNSKKKPELKHEAPKAKVEAPKQKVDAEVKTEAKTEAKEEEPEKKASATKEKSKADKELENLLEELG